MHGYSVGSYPEGFSQVGTSAPGRIQQDLEDNCQVNRLQATTTRYFSKNLSPVVTVFFLQYLPHMFGKLCCNAFTLETSWVVVHVQFGCVLGVLRLEAEM